MCNKNWSIAQLYSNLFYQYFLHSCSTYIYIVQKHLDLQFRLNNYVNLLEGYDKLKPFGFPIHGAIDGYSRKVFWLEVIKSNNSATVPAQLYFGVVKQLKGCPVVIGTDCGTENGTMAAMQCFFRANGNDEFCRVPAPQFARGAKLRHGDRTCQPHSYEFTSFKI